MADIQPIKQVVIRFTLLEAIGKGRIDVEVTAAQAAEALDHYRLRAHDVQHHDPQA